MAIQLQINKSHVSDLKKIIGLGSDVMSKVVEAIEKKSPKPLTPEELRAVVGEVVQDNEHVVSSLLRQVLPLASLKRSKKLETSVLVDALRDGLKSATPKLDEETVIKWGEIEPSFTALLSSRVVETVAKTVSLSYDYANLLQSTRIVTDVRPIFDNDATSIEGAVVSFTLRLSFDNNEGNHGLSLAMNQADVKKLKEQCQRALDKALLAQQTFSKPEVRITISGSDDNDPQ